MGKAFLSKAEQYLHTLVLWTLFVFGILIYSLCLEEMTIDNGNDEIYTLITMDREGDEIHMDG